MTTEHVIGKYQLDTGYGSGSSIELNSDSSFLFEWQAGFMVGATKGTWELSGRKIILNSEHKPNRSNERIYEVLKLNSSYSDSIIIEVFFSFIYRDIPDEPAPFIQCSLKSDNEVLFVNETDINGVAKLPRTSADSLIVDPYGYGTCIIRHEIDSSVTHYVVKIFDNPQTWNYQFFTDEVWRYKKGRLYDPSIKKGKYQEKTYYERIK